MYLYSTIQFDFKYYFIYFYSNSQFLNQLSSLLSQTLQLESFFSRMVLANYCFYLYQHHFNPKNGFLFLTLISHLLYFMNSNFSNFLFLLVLYYYWFNAAIQYHFHYFNLEDVQWHFSLYLVFWLNPQVMHFLKVEEVSNQHLVFWLLLQLSLDHIFNAFKGFSFYQS